jgi:hypothetical protein
MVATKRGRRDKQRNEQNTTTDVVVAVAHNNVIARPAVNALSRPERTRNARVTLLHDSRAMV